MKLKKLYGIKYWKSLSRKSKKELIEENLSFKHVYKNYSKALYHAKKALEFIKKDAEVDCGFWYEENRSYYKECCLAHPRYGCLGDNEPLCPLNAAKLLIKALDNSNEYDV